jgi:2'-5' RNA ligase
MIRLFAALEIPASVRCSLLALQGGVPGARWQREDQLHLTLRFIGEADEAVAADIDEVLSQIEAPSFTLSLKGVGAFGGRKPHALWAGIGESETLHRLQGKIETGLQRLGLPPDARKFAAHVTLARLKHAPQDKVMEFLSAHNLFSTPPFTVDQFALFSSHLSHNGSIYRVERSYPLQSLSSIPSISSSDNPK